MSKNSKSVLKQLERTSKRCKSMNPRQNINALHRPQHGGALILMMLILILGVAAVMMSSIGTLNSRPAVVLDPVTKQGLMAAKEGLITWAAMRGISGGPPFGTGGTEVPPGLLPYPDRNGPAEAPPNYDGQSDCPPISSTYPNFTWQLGKLPIKGESSPCRGLGMSIADTGRSILDSRDSAGETIWYAASSNLLDHLDPLELPPTINSSLLGTTTNWLTVCDQSGNILSDQVAFVVIAPGSALPGQIRPAAGAITPAPAPSNYLDAYALPATGQSPCNSATEKNSDYNNVFIANSGVSTQFNDQLLYVTKREFFTRVTMAVAKNISKQLQGYYSTHGNKFPNPAAAIPNDGSCVDTTPINTWGRLPVQCSPLDTTTPPFMIDTTDTDGWYGAITYKVNDVAHQKVTIHFDQCAIDYIYEWNGSQFVLSHNLPTC